MARSSDSDFIVPSLPVQLSAEESIAVARVKTILLPLGVYRNLTTLIGAIISLHPQGLVLNHGATRLLSIKEIDFLRRGTLEAQARFLEIAILLLQGGDRAHLGGSILKSHAFDDPRVGEAYTSRYGTRMLKDDEPLVLYWKDSQRLYNHIKQSRGGIDQVVAAFDNVKFLLPVRNPIHCARSNLKTGHWQHFMPGKPPGFRDVVAKILSIIRAIATHPSLTAARLFVLWEWELTTQALPVLCDFLGLRQDLAWLEMVPAAVTISERRVKEADREIYAEEVDRQFADLAQLREKLMRFAEA